MTEDKLQTELEWTFLEAEQAGLRMAIRGRLIALLAIAGWYLLSRQLPVALQVVSVVAVCCARHDPLRADWQPP